MKEGIKAKLLEAKEFREDYLTGFWKWDYLVKLYEKELDAPVERSE